MKLPYLTAEDIEAWAAFERANARAADQAEAVPIAHANTRRIAKCENPACRCDVPAYGLCRWCRKGEQR